MFTSEGPNLASGAFFFLRFRISEVLPLILGNFYTFGGVFSFISGLRKFVERYCCVLMFYLLRVLVLS